MIKLPKVPTISDSLSIEQKYYEPTNLVVIDAQVFLENNPNAMDDFLYTYKFRLTESSHTAMGDISIEYADERCNIPFIGVDKFRKVDYHGEPEYFDVYKIECGKELGEYCVEVAEDNIPIGHVLIKSGWIIVADADNEETKKLLSMVDKDNYTIIPDFVGTIQAAYTICDLGCLDEGYCSDLSLYAADYTAYTVFDLMAYSEY